LFGGVETKFAFLYGHVTFPMSHVDFGEALSNTVNTAHHTYLAKT